MQYDTILLDDAKRRLRQTGLFFKVDAFSLKVQLGYRVYIIVREKFYFLPYDFGGELYGLRYGKQKIWWRLRVGMEYRNFRGRAEILRVGGSIWDWHSLNAGWYKPLLPSPWYFSIGAAVHQLPDQIYALDHTILKSYVFFGRKLPYNSRAQFGLVPMYRRRIWYDTLKLPAKIPEDTVHVSEAFSLLGFRTDHRSSYFDPDSGWLLNLSLQSNALYHGVAPSFLQFNGDFRMYLKGFHPTHKIAFRSTATFRNRDAGKTHRLLIGGEGELRGYARSQFGLMFYANDVITSSIEYRFPIYELPELPMYPLNEISPYFKAVSYRLDGALIFDYGRVAPQLEDLLTPFSDRIESGTGLGAGLRILSPTFEHSVCVDVVWGTYPWAPRGHLKFMPEPMWHFYMDLFF
jgi:outer membrane protein assembly factor BamA